MKLNSLKELSPVFYGTGVVKILPITTREHPSICFTSHWHERMELLRVYSGELVAVIGEESIVLKGGQIGIVPPCKIHSGKSGVNGVRYHTVMFDIASFYNDTRITSLLLKPLSEQKAEFCSYTESPEILSAVDSIIELCGNSKDASAQLMGMGKIYETLGLLYRHCLVSANHESIPDDRLKYVLDYINANFLEDITSSSLCKKFGYSQGYFSRRFKAVTGISPAVYIRTLRLEEAKRSLRDTDNSVGNIASCCGFSDISYFCRCFKNNYGMSPSEYAKSERKGEKNDEAL